MANNHKRILLRVAESALNGAEIHLCTKVVAIQDQPGPEQNPRVLVHTDGRSFDFDEVVLTVPLGCLKRNDIAFNPPVPSAIEQAINATSYSRLEKVYISFPAAFWDTASHQLSPLTNIPSDGSFVESREWASGDHKNSVPRFPGFAHFLCPTYSAQNPECWTLEVQSLSSSIHFGEYARPTLLFSIYGPCATHITSLITSLSPSSPQYFTAINDFFRPYYALLPNYVPEHPDCHPRMVLATDWHHDELAGCGSYMNFQVRKDIENGQDAVMLEDDIRALREGMPERGIWLAGEHTAPFVALGTTTGAYWSGESVGMRILGAYGLAKPGMTDSGVDSTI